MCNCSTEKWNTADQKEKKIAFEWPNSMKILFWWQSVDGDLSCSIFQWNGWFPVRKIIIYALFLFYVSDKSTNHVQFGARFGGNFDYFLPRMKCLFRIVIFVRVKKSRAPSFRLLILLSVLLWVPTAKPILRKMNEDFNLFFFSRSDASSSQSLLNNLSFHRALKVVRKTQ